MSPGDDIVEPHGGWVFMSFADHAGYFDSDGVKIQYVMQGEGEPVILMHGFVFSMGPNWIDSGVIEALSQDYRVVALDLRGHGESGKPHDAGSYGLEMINDVLRLMDYLELGRVHLVGYSLGAVLALKLIEVAPERLLSLVLGGAGWVQDGDFVHQNWIKVAELLEKVKPGESISSHFWPNESERPSREIQQIVDNNDPVALAAVSRGMLNVTVTEDVLRSNRVPILGVFGEHDPAKPSGASMEGIARNFTMLLVPGLDHHTLPGSEEFRGAIRKFISNRKGRR
jgi:pimeloyl-ACP methyl ester carboxylesterase